MEKTYLELLAENDEEARKEFEPNAKDLLTASFVEYDDIEAHDTNQLHELEDQHEFQRPQGSHQAATIMPDPVKNVHRTTSDVRYDKDTYTHVISIDSRFRTDQGSNPSNFLFKLVSPIKNVISVRLSSLEIPNTWYTFSDIRGNTSMVIQSTDGNGNFTVFDRTKIEEGNYSVNTLRDDDILLELYNKLNDTVATANLTFGVYFSSVTGKLTLACFQNNNFPVVQGTPLSAFDYNNQPKTDPTKTGTPGYPPPVLFSINFADGKFSNRDSNFGLGYNLGFRIYQTDYAYAQAATSIIDVLDSNYVFLSLNPDWRVVEHNQPDGNQTPAFAKVIVDVAKNDIVYDNGYNTITRRFVLRQPTNITAFNIAILDEYEEYVQLEGGNVSMTLEVIEVLHASLYESMREH